LTQNVACGKITQMPKNQNREKEMSECTKARHHYHYHYHYHYHHYYLLGSGDGLLGLGHVLSHIQVERGHITGQWRTVVGIYKL